ncbi:atpase aaa+ type core protein [Diplodia corticola]|uniref:Atpase aaa+ type core protein n=1 Tax=Diplodia corticola TaxID=236234 RepID=A0A1J9SJ01_9PEZI|nr:atpase aaa+ type core protein [Diplodia corticola]OJD40335.1 atpase aaa+ type core protein [Diplodia corticola]
MAAPLVAVRQPAEPPNLEEKIHSPATDQPLDPKGLESGPSMGSANETSGLSKNKPQDTAEATKGEKKSVGIRYRVECDEYSVRCGPQWSEEQDDVPFDLESQGLESESPDDNDKPSPVLEVITSVNVDSRRHDRRMRDDAGSDDVSDTGSVVEDRQPKRSLKTTSIRSLGPTRMEIHSPLLLQVIRDVVDYYPTQNLTGDVVTVHEPYWVLVHYYPELKKIYQALVEEQEDSVADSSGEDERTKKKNHLGVLLKFLTPHFEQHVSPIDRRLAKTTPTVKWEDIWYLLKPGEFAYCLFQKTWIGCVIQSVVVNQDDWEVGYWVLDHPLENCIQRARGKLSIKSFEGEQAVASLSIIPRHVFDRLDGGELREKLEKRGEKVCNVLWKRHQYLYYKGTSMDDNDRLYDGPIIAESENRSNDSLPGTKWTFEEDDIPKDDDFVRMDVTGGRKIRPKFADFMSIDPVEDPRSKMTKDHLFLLCPAIISFALKTKEWHVYNVENMRELQEPKYIPDTHIGDENLDIINALSYRQIHSKDKWSADFIKDKGEGVVVLLHGPPGVGKTYTVESTAVATRRPLISLTLADIGTKEENIENELGNWFDLAHRWQSILLIDEADIFLERRMHTDMGRNGVVSAFLRKTEYFGGLLFLTTNRVGHIDEAFLSRVHVVIYLPPLDDDKRKSIWQSFFKKLKDERKGKIRVTPKAQSFVVENAEVLEVKWNGREIRNAFQTAIALAEYESSRRSDFEEGEEILVEPEHFQRVVRMSKRFHAYIDDIKKDDEVYRARNYYGRSDRWEEIEKTTMQEVRHLAMPR